MTSQEIDRIIRSGDGVTKYPEWQIAYQLATISERMEFDELARGNPSADRSTPAVIQRLRNLCAKGLALQNRPIYIEDVADLLVAFDALTKLTTVK